MRSFRALTERRAKPRRTTRRWPRLRAPSLRATLFGAAATIAIVGVAGAVYLWRDGLPNAVRAYADAIEAQALIASARAGLSVQEIYVEGRGETPAADVLAVLDLSRNAPILSFDPDAARIALERLPWVRTASVERRLPDSIYVKIAEREPLALWQRHNKLALIDMEGTEVAGVDVERFANLPMVVGDDAPRHAAALLAMIETEPSLAKRVVSAVRVADRRWNVNLDAGDSRVVEVQLPELNPGMAWSRFAELTQANSLFERNVTAIDLRLVDRLVVRVVQPPPPPPVKKGAAPAKKST